MAAAALATATLAAACSPSPVASPSPSASTTASSTPQTTAPGIPSPTPTGGPNSPEPTASGTCEAFGTTTATTSSSEWAAHLSSDLWGADMRVGRHDCYDRWVFEFAGDGGEPGWSVTPHDASAFVVDPSGEMLAPVLFGTASLEVSFGAWYDGTPLGEDPYLGVSGTGLLGGGITEARILSGFEGITQVGIGLDEVRPYRVFWLDDPGRLVIDVFTG